MHHNLHQTLFQAQPLRNVVGVGDVTAYQIAVSQGITLGTFGEVVVPAQAEICNDPEFDRKIVRNAGRFPPVSWFRRMLATLQQ